MTLLKIPLDRLNLNEEQVPTFIPVICEYLKTNCLSEGIFRIPGDHAKLALIDEYLACSTPTLPPKCTTQDIASFIKLWLRELPIPIIIPNIFNQYFISQDVKSVYSVIDHLSMPYRRTLAYIFSMLKSINDNSDVNHMNMNNLCTCFVTALTQNLKDIIKPFPFSLFYNTLIQSFNCTETDFITPLSQMMKLHTYPKTRDHIDMYRRKKTPKKRRRLDFSTLPIE